MTVSYSSQVVEIHQHLCGKGLHGDVTEWCEMRGDCVWVVTCPDCRKAFTIDEDGYEALVALSHAEGQSCGVVPVNWTA